MLQRDVRVERGGARKNVTVLKGWIRYLVPSVPLGQAEGSVRVIVSRENARRIYGDLDGWGVLTESRNGRVGFRKVRWHARLWWGA